MKPFRGNDLYLGNVVGRNVPLKMPHESRSTHLYVSGSTGTGKSKFLENLLRQDIANWSKTKCGLLLIDPHGSLYDSLVKWVTWTGMKRPIIPIDLRQLDWSIAYNVLRQRPEAEAGVVVDNFVQSMAYVWGEFGTDKTPLFARWAYNILWALYEKKMTLLEAEYLIDRTNSRVRKEITQGLSKYLVAQDWELADKLTSRDFDNQISSTVNRLRPFLDTKQLRHILGQNGASLDLGKALNDGAIVLVNLSTEKSLISEENASLFATLLLTDLWTAARERGKGTTAKQVKPFYVYIDEFQRFITPTIAESLDQARGFGLHLTLANQFIGQLLNAGPQGKQVHDSIMANARSKVVFETRGEENLRPLVFDLFTGVMNPDEIKHELYSTKVMSYREEMRTSYSTGKAKNVASASFTGVTTGNTSGGKISEDVGLNPNSWNATEMSTGGGSDIESESDISSKTESPVLMPVVGKEVSHVQFRTLEEQIFRAMATLFDQEQRQAVARIVGMRAPVSIWTPIIHEFPTTDRMAKSFLRGCYKKLKFATPTEKVEKELAKRKKKFTDKAENQAARDPIPRKRRLR